MVSWAAPAEPLSSIVVQSSAGPSTVVSPDATSTTMQLGGQGMSVYFTVTFVYADGTQTYASTNSVSAPVQGPPQNFAAVETSPEVYTLTWNAAPGSPASYVLEVAVTDLSGTVISSYNETIPSDRTSWEWTFGGTSTTAPGPCELGGTIRVKTGTASLNLRAVYSDNNAYWSGARNVDVHQTQPADGCTAWQSPDVITGGAIVTHVTNGPAIATNQPDVTGGAGASEAAPFASRYVVAVMLLGAALVVRRARLGRVL